MLKVFGFNLWEEPECSEPFRDEAAENRSRGSDARPVFFFRFFLAALTTARHNKSGALEAINPLGRTSGADSCGGTSQKPAARRRQLSHRSDINKLRFTARARQNVH